MFSLFPQQYFEASGHIEVKSDSVYCNCRLLLHVDITCFLYVILPELQR